MTGFKTWLRSISRTGSRQNPRELLKTATNPRLAVLALVVSSLSVGIFINKNESIEQQSFAREQYMMGLALDQTRITLMSGIAALAERLSPPGKFNTHDELRLFRRSLVDSLGLDAASLLMLVEESNGADISLGSNGPLSIQTVEEIRKSVKRARTPRSDTSDDGFSDLFVQETVPALLSHIPLGTSAGATPRALTVVYRLDANGLAALRERFSAPELTVATWPSAPKSGMLHVPLRNGSGALVATLSWKAPSNHDDMRRNGTLLIGILLTAMLVIVLTAYRKRREITDLVGEVETQAYDIAMRDPLTGMLNRASFKRKVETELNTRTDDELVGVIYIDLDRFKQVNDGYGHLKGDELLCAVSERLRELSDTGLAIARLGGDEFAMLVEGRRRPEQIMQLAHDACACLSVPFILGELEASIGGSVGVAIAPFDGEDHTELLRRADIAMYRAKTGGRNMTVRFNASMDKDVQERRILENDLRRAIENNQLWVAYQPFWGSDGQTLVGVEALLRWSHPERGEISPGFFVPLAEEAGLIHEIGDWMFRRAMTECGPWRGIVLAVNVSPAQFKRPGLVQRFKEMIAEAGFEAHRLEIEITEGVLMDDADAAVKFIRAFREFGAHVALDDFGTGYSSLSYLRRFPFDKLKVDQSFVRALGSGPGTSAIIHSVIGLGRALGLTVHAEGVETLEHHVFLRAAGCHHLQGFYFARPMPASQIRSLLERVSVRPAMLSFDLAEEPDPSVKAPPAQGPVFEDGADLGAQLRARVATLKAAMEQSAVPAGDHTRPPRSAAAPQAQDLLVSARK